MKYLKRPVAVTAERFDGTIEDARRLSILHGGDVTLEVGTHGAFIGNLVVHSPDGRHLARPGDFIVTDGYGYRKALHPSVFNAIYRPAGDSD